MSDQPNNPENPTPPVESPAPFEAEQMDFLTKTINAASSSHASRVAKAMRKDIDEIRATITEALAANKAAVESGQKTKKEGEDDADAIRKQSDARLKAVEAQLMEEKKARKAEYEKSLRQEERSKLSDALRAGGVDGPFLGAAQALLYTEEKRIARDADGNVVFKFQREGYEEELPVDAGVAEWLSSEAGKHFRPAKPVGGSGARGGQAPNIGSRKKSRSERKREFYNAVMSDMRTRR